MDAAGQPRTRAPKRAITVNDLMLHTSGLCYEFFSADDLKYRTAKGIPTVVSSSFDSIRTVLLHEPVSPHIAAAHAGVAIDIAHIASCYHALAALADAVVVEGAGGFMVPLSPHETGADLAAALGLPVVLVVGLRLGCLNHALLTADAIRARGLRLAGWVANHVDPAMLAQSDNIAFLQQQLGAPLLASIAFMPHADPSAVAINLPTGWAAS